MLPARGSVRAAFPARAPLLRLGAWHRGCSGAGCCVLPGITIQEGSRSPPAAGMQGY